jgi:hypothetical protein
MVHLASMKCILACYLLTFSPKIHRLRSIYWTIVVWDHVIYPYALNQTTIPYMPDSSVSNWLEMPVLILRGYSRGRSFLS